MKLTSFLQRHNLDNSLLLGFYGGGNYGDELLMEVLAGLLQQQDARQVSIAYQHPERYGTFHHEFGYPRINIHNKKAMVGAVLQHKNIIVGGGGLWGMDTNPNILAMSLMMLFSRIVLRKKIYLLAVGYYNSAPRMGRIGAWCAAKAANEILARDSETYHNFKRLQPHTYLDTDIAYYIDQLDLEPYAQDLSLLEQRIHLTGKSLFITLRRFNNGQEQQLRATIARSLEQNTDKPIIIALMEPRHVDPNGFDQLKDWKRLYPNVQIIDFGGNPLALFLFFRAHHDQLMFIGPQFHGILSAHLTGVPYLPLAYDNKVDNLLQSIAPKTPRLTIQSLRPLDVQRFIDLSY